MNELKTIERKKLISENQDSLLGLEKKKNLNRVFLLLCLDKYVVTLYIYKYCTYKINLHTCL